MRREIKEVISGIVLVFSIVGIYLFTQQMIFSTSNTGYYGIAILVMVALCLISMIALIAFSSSGWSIEGSCGEWVAAAFMNPLILLFYNNKDKENDVVVMKMEHQKWDEEYWNRSK